ncbi:hypothetical protein GH714_001010 [Hevea brasiliensis]|uniref:NB-ARC domain-containing protein n=1 Tax=Hevea brasiliensis TaxID=3981 RepID=A0A6A6KZI4_HEVBR|nr:hypothetical protein GH714_001010 [Hevea brasiliensis]
MAEAVFFNIANEIFKKLESQALIEIGRWWNLEDDLEKLKNTVSTIQAVLLESTSQGLAPKEKNLSVISIVGIGGLGKTTLAQIVYNDERVKTYFELKGWVCVSENFDVKLIIEKILDSMIGQRPDNLGVDALKNKLHADINGKKYIIVLDEVWNEDAQNWLSLRDVLVASAKESKIIITTHSKIVAKRARSSSIYELKGLSPAESWSLFKKIAFDQRQKPSLSQEALG